MKNLSMLPTAVKWNRYIYFLHPVYKMPKLYVYCLLNTQKAWKHTIRDKGCEHAGSKRKIMKMPSLSKKFYAKHFQWKILSLIFEHIS